MQVNERLRGRPASLLAACTALAASTALAACTALVAAGCSPSGSAGARGRTPAGATEPGPTATAAAPPSTGATTTAVPAPPYPVTTTTLPLVDTSRPTVSRGRTLSTTRPLTTLVWAPAVPGRWPLVVFGHGYQVGPGPYTTLLRAWAADGYVVAAPEFPLSDQAVAGANLDEGDIDNEPGDLRFVIDSLVAPTSAVAARIDATRVATAGHSDGAEAALAEAQTPPPPGQPPVRAVIAMSVNPLPGTTRAANPPLLVTQGDADPINPFSEGLQTYRQAALAEVLPHPARRRPPSASPGGECLAADGHHRQRGLSQPLRRRHRPTWRPGDRRQPPAAHHPADRVDRPTRATACAPEEGP